MGLSNPGDGALLSTSPLLTSPKVTGVRWLQDLGSEANGGPPKAIVPPTLNKHLLERSDPVSAASFSSFSATVKIVIAAAGGVDQRRRVACTHQPTACRPVRLRTRPQNHPTWGLFGGLSVWLLVETSEWV